MYAQTACTVSDCIAMLLSRKAKLKGEKPPPAKPYISTFAHKANWMVVHQISYFVCVSVYHLPFHLLLCLVFKSLSPCLSFFFELSASLLVVVHLTFFSSSASLFFCVSSLSFFRAAFLFVCLRIRLSLQSICLSATSRSYLSCQCSSTRRHNTLPIMI